MTTLPRNPSFTPSPALRENLQANREQHGVTGRLNMIWDRYALMLSQTPAMSEREWWIFGNTLMGSYVEPLLIKHLDAELEDSHAGEPEERRRLADRVRNMSYGERIALIEKLEAE